jgi:hypothetical protein
MKISHRAPTEVAETRVKPKSKKQKTAKKKKEDEKEQENLDPTKRCYQDHLSFR